MMIERYLDELERRIDPCVEEQLLSEWKAFLERKVTAGFFSPHRTNPSPPDVEWPEISVNEALDSPENMALQQLSECSVALAEGTGAIMNVRTNYGTGILSSVFGGEVFRMDDELNTLPTTRPLDGGCDAIRRLLDAGPPDLATGYGGKCFDTGRYFVDLFRNYPNISKYVHIYHPDLQGPMDIAELLWGSKLFVDLIDLPDLAHSLLRLITEAYIRFMRQWEEIVPPQNGYASHWGLLHKGRIMLRDDSAMNLSSEMFGEFIGPYDQQLLSEFGGGAIHFCGRGDHYIHHLAEMKGVYGVNMSQPECNDMERIFKNTIDKQIAIIGLPREAAESAANRGRDLHGMVHCW
jgi:hypothetical protein